MSKPRVLACSFEDAGVWVGVRSSGRLLRTLLGRRDSLSMSSRPVCECPSVAEVGFAAKGDFWKLQRRRIYGGCC